MTFSNGRSWFEERGECVVEANDSATPYGWDQFDVWRRKSDGRLFLYRSGGCSCDWPYDHVSSWEDLEPVTSLVAFKRDVDRSHEFTSADERMRSYAVVARLIGDGPGAS